MMPSPSSRGERPYCCPDASHLTRLRFVVCVRSIVCGVHANKKRDLLQFLAKFYSQQSYVGQVRVVMMIINLIFSR